MIHINNISKNLGDFSIDGVSLNIRENEILGVPAFSHRRGLIFFYLISGWGLCTFLYPSWIFWLKRYSAAWPGASSSYQGKG